ncbi:hypothetical protein HY090_02195 [Candidatus Kaiserbacteria bacterium]|nr:hypothetical protein [Candidatus Kaiserbacteria bacterium]
MTYFLDFDRTLFDTSAFLAYLIKRENRTDIYDSSETDMATAFNAAAAAGLLSFVPGELAQFMFPDAEAFLDVHQRESVVVTFGNPALQRAKLENVFSSRPELNIVYTGEERKGPFILRLMKEYPAPYSFFDDKPVELASVGSVSSDIALYEVRRDAAVGSGSYLVLHSFEDLT